MSRQGLLLDVDPYARHDLDFYATPRWMVQALLRRMYLAPGAVVCEPCVGDGAILRAISAEPDMDGLTFVTGDLVARDGHIPDVLGDATQLATWRRLRATRGRITVTLTNPPFDVSFAILQRALAASEHGVAILNRCTWIEPTDDRGEWLAKHPPSAQIVLPRWNFRSRDGKGGNDSAPPSWFVWNRKMRLIEKGIYVVTKAERDARVAEERRG